MDETIDYGAVIAQLQLENEMLRSNMKLFADVQQTVYKIPTLLEELWHKAMANKYQVVVGLMLIYWTLSVAFLLIDRLRGNP